MELGRAVCGVHAQTREVPCGTDGVGSLGGYPHMTLPAEFKSDLL